MKVSFKRRIRQKYVTVKVRQRVQELFGLIEFYEDCIKCGTVVEEHTPLIKFNPNSLSNPTANHIKKLDEMKKIVEAFYRSLRNIERKFNNEESKIFKSFFVEHKTDFEIRIELGIHKDKYYDLKGYVYFLLVVGFNILDTDNIEVKKGVKVMN